jgi:hypothetical protein
VLSRLLKNLPSVTNQDQRRSRESRKPRAKLAEP